MTAWLVKEEEEEEEEEEEGISWDMFFWCFGHMPAPCPGQTLHPLQNCKPFHVMLRLLLLRAAR
jgi:hypothetical protein